MLYLEEILSEGKYACLDVVCHFPLSMLIKNTELYEIPLLRFWTNGSEERKQIVEILDRLIG